MNNLKPLKLNRGGQGGIIHYVLLGFLVILAGLVILSLFWWKKPAASSSVVNLVLGRESLLEEDKGRVNVLLLGIAGKGHDGPNLTDTIIVGSYNVDSSKATLISLPRDLWVDKHKAKVNTLYQLGLNKGEGLDFARKEIGDMLGLKIPYVIKVDFSGFVKAIDLVGGIDVDVEKPFDDYFYPLPGKEKDLCKFREEEKEVNEEEARHLGVEPGKLKVLLDPEGEIATAAAKPGVDIVYTDQQIFQLFPCRFEHLSFKQGITHMDGETALKFVRSRHGTNNEGTDFARSKRQQRVLQAFKNKALSLDTLANPQRINGLIKTFGESIETNIPQAAYPEFAKLVKKMKEAKSFVLTNGGENPLLTTPPVWEYGAWVLIPPNNDFSRIQKFIEDALSDNLETTESAKSN